MEISLFGQFPSPVGELHFSMNIDRAMEELRAEFPSPVGELHFSIETYLVTTNF